MLVVSEGTVNGGGSPSQSLAWGQAAATLSVQTLSSHSRTGSAATQFITGIFNSYLDSICVDE